MKRQNVSDGKDDVLDLRSRLVAAGCFRAAPLAYAIRIVVVVSAVLAGYVGLLVQPEWGSRLLCIGLIAFASVQAAFIAHDVGDGAVTKNKTAALFLRQFLMSFISATSSTYFHFLHRMHHITVDRGRRGLGRGDYAVNPYEIRWLKKIVAWNGLVFMATTICLRAITFRLESLRFVARNIRGSRLDIQLIALHYAFWLAVPAAFVGFADMAINYLLIALVAGPYIGVVLVLNHEGMSKAHEHSDLPMMDRVVKTTRNLGQSWWNDLLFGGVNNHIEHHLFPEIPVVRLGEARAITREFCRRRGYSYVEVNFHSALMSAASHFAAMPGKRLEQEALS
jgi:fatty acid desaturase